MEVKYRVLPALTAGIIAVLALPGIASAEDVNSIQNPCLAADAQPFSASTPLDINTFASQGKVGIAQAARLAALPALEEGRQKALKAARQNNTSEDAVRTAADKAMQPFADQALDAAQRATTMTLSLQNSTISSDPTTANKLLKESYLAAADEVLGREDSSNSECNLDQDLQLGAQVNQMLNSSENSAEAATGEGNFLFAGPIGGLVNDNLTTKRPDIAPVKPSQVAKPPANKQPAQRIQRNTRTRTSQTTTRTARTTRTCQVVNLNRRNRGQRNQTDSATYVDNADENIAFVGAIVAPPRIDNPISGNQVIKDITSKPPAGLPKSAPSAPAPAPAPAASPAPAPAVPKATNQATTPAASNTASQASQCRVFRLNNRRLLVIVDQTVDSCINRVVARRLGATEVIDVTNNRGRGNND